MIPTILNTKATEKVQKAVASEMQEDDPTTEEMLEILEGENEAASGNE